MRNGQVQKKNYFPSDDACDFGEKQARLQMNKEEERKQIGKMMKRI